MTSAELVRKLKKAGCTFVPAKGGHQIVFLGTRRSVISRHGSGHEVPRGTLRAIERDLGLKLQS